MITCSKWVSQITLTHTKIMEILITNTYLNVKLAKLQNCLATKIWSFMVYIICDLIFKKDVVPKNNFDQKRLHVP